MEATLPEPPVVLSLEGEQARYASPSLAAYWEETREERVAGTLFPFLIEENGRPVGFFALCTEPARLRACLAPTERTALLRNFFITTAEQGRGLGARALEALPALASERFPDVEALYLVVNFVNETARRAYLRHGWEDTGRVYTGGSVGPAHLLVCRVACCAEAGSRGR